MVCTKGAASFGHTLLTSYVSRPTSDFNRGSNEQPMHHSVWPPSTNGNNTQSRNSLYQRKSEALPGQTETGTRKSKGKRNTTNLPRHRITFLNP